MPRLLVVEDNDPLREAVCEGLRGEGFEVVEAADGGAAWEIVQRGSFDLVVLDGELPRLDGRQVLVLMRARGWATPVLLVSGSLELSGEEQARLGVGQVLRKPVPLAELARRIRAELDPSDPGPS